MGEGTGVEGVVRDSVIFGGMGRWSLGEEEGKGKGGGLRKGGATGKEVEVQARGGGLVEPRREGHSHGTRVGGPPRGIPGGLAT